MARNINNKRRSNDGGKNLLYIALGVAAVAIVAAFLLWPSKNTTLMTRGVLSDRLLTIVQLSWLTD